LQNKIIKQIQNQPSGCHSETKWWHRAWQI